MQTAIRETVKRVVGRAGMRLQPEDLEDLCQETTVELLTRLKSLGDEIIDLDVETWNAAQRAFRTWKAQTEGTIRLDTIPEARSAIVLGVSEDDKPAWIPDELWPVAYRWARGDTDREIAEELQTSKSTVNRTKAKLKALRIPDRQLQWYAEEGQRRTYRDIPEYSRVSSTPVSLDDVPQTPIRPDGNDDQIRLLADRPNDLDKSVWEGLVCSLFAVSTTHGRKYDCRLRWNEDTATCGTRNDN
jgi:DNA-directed RNA polymerase specialized sigma24 family protein